MNSGDPDPDLERRLEKLIGSAGRKRIRTLAHLLAPLLNPRSYHYPGTPQERSEAWLSCPSIPIGEGEGEVFLRNERLGDWSAILDAILGIEEVACVVSRRSVHDSLRRVIGKEVVARAKEGKRTAETELISGLLRPLLAAVDWFTFFFVLEGVKLAGNAPVTFRPATLFLFSEETIAQIGAPRSQEEGAVEFAEDLKQFMRSRMKDKVGLSFRCPGDPQRGEQTAELAARRCVAALRFACCLLFPGSADPRRFAIDVATEPVARRRFKVSIAGGTGQATWHETLVRGIQAFTLDEESVGILKRYAFDDVFSLCCSTAWNELDAAIVSSLEWLGDAQGDPIPSAAYTKYWIALETLLAPARGAVNKCISRSIPVVLAHGCYQFIKPEQIRETARRVATLYDRRCKAVHEGLRDVSPSDLSAVREYASFVLLTFLALRKHGFRSHKEIARETDRLYLQSLRFVRIGASKIYHAPTCRVARRSAAKRLEALESASEAKDGGLLPCRVCHPEP